MMDPIITPTLGLGAVIAMFISWHRNRSIIWLLIHGLFLGWLYVICYVLFMNKDKRA